MPAPRSSTSLLAGIYLLLLVYASLYPFEAWRWPAGAAPGELVAEPATGVETGWAAAWLARLTLQLGVPHALRARWFLARQAAGANCWIGGLVVEAGEGGAAYAVTTPGQVWAWPVGQIRAAEDRTESGTGAWGSQEQTAL